ncbi:MAG: hypothetical protein ACYC0B_09180 [Gemmatimonadaceae bacterium]
MIDGLKLTIPGKTVRLLLDSRIQHHEQCAGRWTRERDRTPEEETEEAPLLPDHICRHEAERHVWRAEVLGFIRDYLEVSETYRLAPADLEFGELLPAAPEWLTQDEYEERSRIGFALERVTKAIEGVGSLTSGLLASRETLHADIAATPPSQSEETDAFRTTHLDVEDGPEVIVIERK